MRVLITGATGGIGRALTDHLRQAAHEVTGLRRETGAASGKPGPSWDPARGILEAGTLSGFDAVVHLSGANIGEGRWTEARKRELWASRIDSTRLLVDRMREAADGPRILVCASAVGYFGDRGDEVLNESSPRGEGFLADLVEAWEREAARATEFGVRVVSSRFGVVMAADDGALRRLATAFRLGVGGRLGSGHQWMSWVAPADLVRAIEWFLTHEVSGPVHVTSPQPVRNADLTRALARVLRRPALFPAPAFALRIALGGAADELLLASQRVMPARLLEAGFEFTYPAIEDALRVALRPDSMSAATGSSRAA
ncbi:MAG: TIGR01777 family protein [Dehalococcoidia bacterium]|nr:TIGR01777 family protein [Dehalococcoidia bacterium]